MTPEHSNLLNFFPLAYNVRRLLGQVEASGKAKASYEWIRQAPPDIFLFQHYEGTGQAISVQPILETGNTCQWGAIDIDSYGDDKLIDQVRRAAQILGLNCFIEQSKSKGVHLYILLDRPTVAKPFRLALKKLAVWLGHPKAEIRPAQDSLDFQGTRDLGSAMVLPGFGLGYEKAKLAFQAATITLEEFNRITDEGSLSDAPPCLFPLQQMGQTPDGLAKVRNLFMYQMSVYLKYKFPGDWQDRLRKYNAEGIAKGIPDNELTALIAQHEKTGSKCHYRCTGEPFESVCNKVHCQFRKFGVAARESSNSVVSEEGITVLQTDPATWFISLTNPQTQDTVRVQLNSDQLLKVENFKKRCMETIYCIPTLPKQKDWEAYVSELLKTAQQLPVPFEMTETARVLDAVYRFCLTMIRTGDPEGLLRGRIWLERVPEGGYYAHFRQVDFTNFVCSGRGAIKSTDVHSVLTELCRLNHMTIEKLDLGSVSVSVYRVFITSQYMEMQHAADLEKEE